MTDAEAETPVVWPPDVKSQLIGEDPDAGKDWRQEEKATTEDKMVGWHHRLDGHEFEQALGDGEDRKAWRAAVHGIAKSWTQLSHWTTAVPKFREMSLLLLPCCLQPPCLLIPSHQCHCLPYWLSSHNTDHFLQLPEQAPPTPPWREWTGSGASAHAEVTFQDWDVLPHCREIDCWGWSLPGESSSAGLEGNCLAQI